MTEVVVLASRDPASSVGIQKVRAQALVRYVLSYVLC